MTIALLTNIISPHQLPLANEVASVIGEENFHYVYSEPFHKERINLGWDGDNYPCWCSCKEENGAALNSADLVYGGERDVDLFERRGQLGRKTFYASERWFKPRIGFFRLLCPVYFKMALRFVKLMQDCKNNFYYYPQGIHAARDMARLCGLFGGDLRCLVRAPELEFNRKPGGKIWLKNGRAGNRYCLDKMRMWGYFVEPSKFKGVRDVKLTDNHDPLTTIKVLWVGRLLKLKRVDTIIRAVGELTRSSSSNSNSNSNFHIQLDIYGSGPEENRLKKQATKYGDVIKFHPPVPIAEVRKLMREHDVYVLASNAYEGWGSVVSEALEEGMRVVGTHEAGASATILPKECLFHSGDWQSLLNILLRDIPSVGIGEWSAKSAANNMLSHITQVGC